jgi:hypothetical protein
VWILGSCSRADWVILSFGRIVLHFVMVMLWRQHNPTNEPLEHTPVSFAVLSALEVTLNDLHHYLRPLDSWIVRHKKTVVECPKSGRQ